LSSQKQDRALQISAQEEKTDKLEADSTATKQSSFNPSSVSEQANTANPVINLNTNGSVNKSSSPSNSGENGKPIQQASVNESNLVSSNGQISKLDIVPELIKDLQQSDRALRRKTIWELAQRADSRAMKPLVELMIEADSQERSLILEAMTQIASRTLKPMNKALMISLQDENSQVRQNAIRDLTRVYELMSQVTKRLALAVEDSDAEVKETAKWALSQLNQIPQVPWNDE
jgi:HEAT repeat protein